MQHIRAFVLVFLTVIILGFIGTADAQENLAQQALAIMEANCFNCHGPDGSFTENLLIDSATGLIDSGAVVPGNPNASTFYQRLIEADPAKRMPLGGAPLSDPAIQTIGEWIQQGAPSWQVRRDVPFITNDEMLTAISDHLETLDPFVRSSARYFTMTHLYNAGELPETLAAARVALSKLVNSLSWGYTIVNPKPIDAAETIFYIDLRAYEWDRRDAWTHIETAYPYVIAYDATTQAVLHQKLATLRETMVCEVPFVHVDWFLATASLPPLYHDILSLPETEAELERELGVDVAGNLQRAPGLRVMRAGTNDSGVSAHNRVVERHAFRNGAYWKSHDFASSVGQKNILQNPLSFDRDGGEVIFNLPNGLQAYYVSDGAGNRIDVAPTAIVSNPAASDPAVRNGLSCIGCHTEGMKTFEDVVRSAFEVQPDSELKTQVLRLYVPKADMDRVVAEDTAHYQRALEATGGVFGEGIEPVHFFHEAFQKPLNASYAAASVGLEATAFVALIRENAGLQSLGLAGLLVSDGNVKRDAWTESFDEIVSCLYGEDCPVPEPVPILTSTPVVVERQRIVRDPSNLVPDVNLRAVLADALGKASGASLKTEDIARLTYLDANERDISDLTGLEHAIRLDWIELRHNAVSDLSPLQGLVKLKGIVIEGNPVSDVSPLAGMFGLEGIDARQTAISDFSPLAKLRRLRWITFGSDKSISKLPSLKGLKALRQLEINSCSISDISGLSELTQLTSLILNDNSISDISPLMELTGLTDLHLGSNLISDVSSLTGLAGLKVLNLHNNVISDISPLTGLTHLERLDLRNNAIADFSSMEKLSEKTVISSANNPGFPIGGPKITGPWVWVMVPGEGFYEGTDLLARASGGKVTERNVATDGATVGAPVGSRVWTSHKIDSRHWNNINKMLDALGAETDRERSNRVVYGSILLNSNREQQTTMFAGSDNGHKIWLNGKLIREGHDGWHHNYEEFFPVTLKQGKNVLLVAVHTWGGAWSGFFGFDPDAEYAVLAPNSGFSLSTDATQIKVGTTFTVHLKAANVTDLAGWQTDITFDPTVLKVNNVNEKNFLKQAGGRTFFQKGMIQNKQGKVTGISVARTSRSGASGQGILLSIRFTALANGETRLTLQNFQAGSSTGKPIPSSPIEIFVVVGGPPAAPAFVPGTTALLHNYPNPFNPETWIPYQLASNTNVEIHIYNTHGALVRRLELGHQPAGVYTGKGRAAYWNGRNEVGEPVVSGIYFYTFTAGDFTATRKMLIRK